MSMRLTRIVILHVPFVEHCGLAFCDKKYSGDVDIDSRHAAPDYIYLVDVANV